MKTGRVLFSLLVFTAAAHAQQLPSGVEQAMNNGLNFGKGLQDSLAELITTTVPGLMPYAWFWLGAVSIASFYKVMFSALASSIPMRHHHQIRVIGILICLFRVTVASAMLRTYMVGGLSFRQVPMVVGQRLSMIIDASAEKAALLAFNNVIHRLPLPHGLQIIESGGYILILILFGAAQFGMQFVSASSLLFEAALFLYGLFFVPLFAHISANAKFWRWWGSLISYAMYPVTASVFSFAFAKIYLEFIDKAVNHNYAIAHMLVLAAYLMLVTPILIVSMFQIPRFNAYLFGEVPNTMEGIMNSVQNAAVSVAAAALL